MKPKSILLVDDEKEIGLILESVFRQEDVTITHVFDGRGARQYVEKNRPDLILLDLQLPDESGMDILQFLRKEGIDSRVVMITAFGTIRNAVEAMKIGADDYLCKPFSIGELQAMVRKELEEGQAQREMESRPVSLEEMEKRHIAAILKKNNGNRKKTADDLGISLRTLYYKIKQYDLG